MIPQIKINSQNVLKGLELIGLSLQEQTKKFQLFGSKVNTSDRDNSPIVSVVVPNFNYDRYLPQCVASILASSLKQIEVIIVDSSDDFNRESVLNEILKEFITDPRLKVFYRSANKLGSNRNFGIEKANAKYVCSIDPDDLVHPHFLAVLVFRAEKYQLDVSGAAMAAFGDYEESWAVKPVVTFLSLNLRNELASNSLFKKSIWQDLGGFVDSDGDPHIHEDWRFWHRVSKVGARIGNVNQPLSRIRIHGRNMSMQPEILPPNIQIELIRNLNKDVKLKPKAIKFMFFGIPQSPSVRGKCRPMSGTRDSKSGTVRLHDSLSGEGIPEIPKVAIKTSHDRSIDLGDHWKSDEFYLNTLLDKCDWEDFLYFLISEMKCEPVLENPSDF